MTIFSKFFSEYVNGEKAGRQVIEGRVYNVRRVDLGKRGLCPTMSIAWSPMDGCFAARVDSYGNDKQASTLCGQWARLDSMDDLNHLIDLAMGMATSSN